MLFFASLTGIAVSRDNSEVSALSWVGSRCCTSTNAMPVRGGKCLSNCVIASKPPADAPMPTIGNDLPRAGDGAETLAELRFALAIGHRTLLAPREMHYTKLASGCTENMRRLSSANGRW